jgi:hypothetical protein
LYSQRNAWGNSHILANLTAFSLQAEAAAAEVEAEEAKAAVKEAEWRAEQAALGLDSSDDDEVCIHEFL